ncbi:unnamed protein product [Rhizophagus irregularis]|uniref:Uncharacterized protein n=1 Tax=Rhizophagus irregularis TaxID=588596 RepID=A0A2N1NY03_9GLOM|nr:hypothetical protein RhiirC2_728821 [Rhizophagus irregularis]CAB4401678.1 unnamed protein product [Rhizophagus irregularis]CAB5359534.1 unnamed protein product [Rhizophagus irregularis]
MSTLKRCNFTNLCNGYRCGCLRCVLQSAPGDDDLCKGCGHHQSYHEDDNNVLQSLNNLQKFNEVLICALNSKYSQYTVPIIPVQQNCFEPQVTLHSDETMHPNTQSNDANIPVQHIEPQNQSHNVLNQSSAHIFEQNFISQSFPVSYISNQVLNQMLSDQNFDQSHVNHNNIEVSSNNIASFANDKFDLICLVGSLKIPKNCARLEKVGLKKEICFHNDSNGQIKKAIEEKLSPHLENVDWMFYKCISSKLVPADDVSIVECRFNDLKRISGSRKKLYIGTKDGPIIMT